MPTKLLQRSDLMKPKIKERNERIERKLYLIVFLVLEEMGAVDDEVIQRQDGRRQLKVKITKDFMLAIIFIVKKKSGMNDVYFTDEDK